MIAKPLTVLLIKMDDNFQMTGQAEDAVDELKKQITLAPVLARLDYNLAKSVGLPPHASDNGFVVLKVDLFWMGAG